MDDTKQLTDKVLEFVKELNKILVYDRQVKHRYSKMYHDMCLNKEVLVYFCKHTSEIIKLVINYDPHNSEFVSILCEDKLVETNIIENQIYKDLIVLLSEVKNRLSQDELFEKLAYNLK